MTTVSCQTTGVVKEGSAQTLRVVVKLIAMHARREFSFRLSRVEIFNGLATDGS